MAEDDFVTATLLEDMLAVLGADVVGTVGSVEDLAAWTEREQAVHAVTLDVNLHGELVYDAAAALRARGVPVVFISAYDELHSCPPELKSAPFVRKPIGLHDLASALTAALSENRAA